MCCDSKNANTSGSKDDSKLSALPVVKGIWGRASFSPLRHEKLVNQPIYDKLQIFQLSAYNRPTATQ